MGTFDVFDMPRDLKLKVGKRITFFMEHLLKRQKSRVDVYVEHLKKISNKEIYAIDDRDVLHFLVFKDVNDSGRTVVHKETCPHLGTPSLEYCSDQIQCGLRHQAESMRVGIVDKLRKRFEEVGRKGPYSPLDQMGILHVLIWSENISLLSGKNKGRQECSLGERRTWRDLRWKDKLSVCGGQ